MHDERNEILWRKSIIYAELLSQLLINELLLFNSNSAELSSWIIYFAMSEKRIFGKLLVIISKHSTLCRGNVHYNFQLMKYRENIDSRETIITVNIFRDVGETYLRQIIIYD